MTENELFELINKVSREARDEPDHLVAIGMYKVLEMLYAERERIMAQQGLASPIGRR